MNEGPKLPKPEAKSAIEELPQQTNEWLVDQLQHAYTFSKRDMEFLKSLGTSEERMAIERRWSEALRNEVLRRLNGNK